MGAKKKSGKRERVADWELCSGCGCYLTPLDKNQHMGANQTTCSVGGFAHIKDGVLHGVISECTLTELRQSSAELSLCERDRLVLLHPTTARLCNLGALSPAVIQDSCVLHAWPNSNIAPTAIALPMMTMYDLGLEACSRVLLKPLLEPHKEATEIYLLASADQVDYKDLKQYLASYYDGQFLCCDQTLLVNYCGCLYRFAVCDIKSSCTISEHQGAKSDLPVQAETNQTLPSTTARMSGSLPPAGQAEASQTILPSTDEISGLPLPAVQSEVSQALLSTTDRKSTLPPPAGQAEADHTLPPTTAKMSNLPLPAGLAEYDRSVKNLKPTEKGDNLNEARRFSTEFSAQLPSKGDITPGLKSRMNRKDNNLSKDENIQFFKVTAKTRIHIQKELKRNDRSPLYPRIFGHDRQISILQQLLSDLIKHEPEKRKSVGLLLYGQSGIGKTLIGQVLSNQRAVHCVVIKGLQLFSRSNADSELTRIFKEATVSNPALVFIDDLDCMCPAEERSKGRSSNNLVWKLMAELKDLLSKRGALVVASATCVDNVDSRLLQAGLLEIKLQLLPPSAIQRHQMLQYYLPAHPLPDELTLGFSHRLHGYVGADIALLAEHASLLAASRAGLVNSDLYLDDLEKAREQVTPVSMRGHAADVAKVTWSDIGGQCELKRKLLESVDLPYRHPEVFSRLGQRPPKGLLMYGPPGCSKTMIAKALAHESGFNFFSIKASDLFSKWLGDSEQAVKDLFVRAQAAAPSLVFFDEIDAITQERSGSESGGSGVGDRVLTVLLGQMDGVSSLKDVFVLAATNRPDRIDKALLRPGRFDRKVYVPLPDLDTRCEILRIRFLKMPVSDDVIIQELAERMEGYSGAEIVAVCVEAALAAMTENLEARYLRMDHFETALQSVLPATTPEMTAFYEIINNL